MALRLFEFMILVTIIHVSTSKPYDTTVIDITAESAVVYWKTTEKATKIERFKVHCNGTRRYISTNGQTSLDTYDKIQYAPAGNDNLLLGDLQPNVNYSCIIWEHINDETQVLHGQVSEPFGFATDYGAPEAPTAPNVQTNTKNHSISIRLFSTSTRFGPVSGYQVQFHLVESKISENLPLIDDELFEPFSPLSPLVAKTVAKKSTKAKSFWIDFKDGTLPGTIIIDEYLLNGSLKRGLEYIVVTVPYTFSTKSNRTTILFTPSQMSTIFRTYTQKAALLNINEQADMIICITLGVLLPVVVLFYLFCFGTIVYCVIRRRKKKKEKKHTRRDVVEEAARTRAEEQGDELPWYYQQDNEDTQEDQTMDNQSSSSQMGHSTFSGAQTQSAHGKQETVIIGQGQELRQFTRETNQTTYDESGPSPREQDNQVLLTPPMVAETKMYEDQHLIVPSVSAESWLSPNASPSTSLTSEHARLTQTSKVELEQNHHTSTDLEEYSLAGNEMSNKTFEVTQQSSDGCDLCSVSDINSLSSDMIDMAYKEAMFASNVVTSHFDEKHWNNKVLEDDSLSDVNNEWSEDVNLSSNDNLPEKFDSDSALNKNLALSEDDLRLDKGLECVSSNSTDRQNMSAVKENVDLDQEETQGEEIVESADDHIFSNDFPLEDVELLEKVNNHGNICDIEEAFIDDTFKNSDSRPDLNEDPTISDRYTIHGMLKSVDKHTVLRQWVTGVNCKEPHDHPEGILEQIDSDRNEDLLTKEPRPEGILDHVDRHVVLRQEVMSIEEPQIQQCVKDRGDLTEIKDDILLDQEKNLQSCEINNDFSKDNSITKDLLVKEKFECVNLSCEEISKHCSMDMDEDLESIDSIDVVREKAHEDLTEKLGGVENYQLHVREEVSFGKEARAFDPVDSNIDQLGNVMFEEQIQACEYGGNETEDAPAWQEVPSNTTANTICYSCGELSAMVKSLSGAKLTHVKGSTDLREDIFDQPMPQVSGMIKRVNSNIDLRDEELSVDMDDVNLGGEVQNSIISIKLSVSESNSVCNEVLETSKLEICRTRSSDISKEDTNDFSGDEHRSTVQSSLSTHASVIQSTSDHISICIEQEDHEESQLFDHSMSKDIVSKSLAPQQISETQSPAQNLASSDSGRSHSQLGRPYSSSSLPHMSQIDQDHTCAVRPSKSFGTELCHQNKIEPLSSNTRNEICDAQSIQLSRISNQSRSTSSGNYSLTSQIFKHSISTSESELSGHHRPPSAKNNGQCSSKPVSNRSKSSLASHQYKCSDESGSSDVIFTNTMGTQRLAETSFKDKEDNSSYCSMNDNSNSFKGLKQTALNSLPVPHSESKVNVIDVFSVNVDNITPHTAPPASISSSHLSSSVAHGQCSQDSLCLHHSKPTINLAHKYSTEEYPQKGEVLQSLNTVAIQLEEPATTAKLSKGTESGVCNSTNPTTDDCEHVQALKLSSESSSDSIKSGVKKSAARIAVTTDSTSDVFLDDVADAKPSTLINKKTKEYSSSEMSSCSTDYYTAQEYIDSLSESSVGKLQSTNTHTCSTGQSAVLSSDSCSDHRDTNQLTEEPLTTGEGNPLLKTSSSASLFIPRGLSTGPQEKSLASISQGRGSTCTLSSILAQLSESSVSEEIEDSQTGHRQMHSPHQSQTDHSSCGYEPY